MVNRKTTAKKRRLTSLKSHTRPFLHKTVFFFETKTGCGVKAKSGVFLPKIFSAFFTLKLPLIYVDYYFWQKNAGISREGVEAWGYLSRGVCNPCVWGHLLVDGRSFDWTRSEIDVGGHYRCVAVERHFYLKDFLAFKGNEKSF